jgi:serine/threonine protein kinase
MSASVCRFYESEQPEYSNNLFMIYCEYSDYSSFKRARRTVMSLLMRLYFLSQLVEGLRFLHARNLYHLDLKPQNMLIGKAFILKITDFGEAYHPNVCSEGTSRVTQTTGLGTLRPMPPPRAVSCRFPSPRSSTPIASVSSSTKPSSICSQFSSASPRSRRSSTTARWTASGT